jgi:hypothetical protein
LLGYGREVLRLRHHSIPTERAYRAWIRRDVNYHTMTRWEDLGGGECTVEASPTHPAMAGKVPPSTQNQAMNALVFLDKRLLRLPLDQAMNPVRARRRAHVPVVLSRDEVDHAWP